MDTALVTGATGYIGTRLTNALAARGVETHVLLHSPPSSETLASLGDAVVHHGTDDVHDLIRLLDRHTPDVVFHLATKYLARHDPEDLDALADANIHFGLRILEAMAKTSCHRLVATASYFEFTGPDCSHAANLYAATKRAFRELERYYVDHAAMRTLTLVLYDVYGPGDRRGKVVDAVIEAVSRNRPVSLPASDRSLNLLHVDDAVEALLVAGNGLVRQPGRFDTEHPFAAATPSPTSLEELVTTVERVLGRSVEHAWGAYPAARLVDWEGCPFPRVPDWAPKINLEEGIRDVVEARVEH